MVDKLLSDFTNYSVLVIGDVMVDAYLNGDVGRISPEAPVPIVDVKERVYRLGGAANVALNLQSLGVNTLVCSVIGQDERATLFEKLVSAHHLSTDFLCHSETRKTTVKYRIIGNGRQMLRIDEENRHPLNPQEQEIFLQKIESLLQHQKIDAIIFEDYDKGVLTPTVIREVVQMARQHGILTAVDPKRRNFHHYQGVTLFKPNLKELREGLQFKAEGSLEEIEQLMRGFAKSNDIAYLFTTLSERGVALYQAESDEFYAQPAYLRQISDVSGAGDTVIAVATICLLAGLSPLQMSQIANLAGGIVCEYAGVTPIPLQKLSDEIHRNQILS